MGEPLQHRELTHETLWSLAVHDPVAIGWTPLRPKATTQQGNEHRTSDHDSVQYILAMILQASSDRPGAPGCGKNFRLRARLWIAKPSSLKLGSEEGSAAEAE